MEQAERSKKDGILSRSYPARGPDGGDARRQRQLPDAARLGHNGGAREWQACQFGWPTHQGLTFMVMPLQPEVPM